MQPADVRNRFIELRAQCWSLNRIAAELHVAKRTLVEWNREARKEIHELKEVEVEALHERVLASYELELQRLTGQLNRIETVLAQRKLDCLSTGSLFVLAATVRAQLRRLTSPALVASRDPVVSSAPVNASSTSAAPESGGAA